MNKQTQKERSDLWLPEAGYWEEGIGCRQSSG